MSALSRFEQHFQQWQQTLDMHVLGMEAVGLCVSFLVAWLLSARIRSGLRVWREAPADDAAMWRQHLYRLGMLLLPLLSVTFINVADHVVMQLHQPQGLLRAASIVAVVLALEAGIRAVVTRRGVASFLRWVGLPLVMLQMFGVLPAVVGVLQAISINLGNISVSVYGIARVLIFGLILFWMGRASNHLGKEIIRSNPSLDVTTREVFAKLFEVALFCVLVLILLNIMGINLTALAVFGGAVGVGLGLGLQSIASNFISGIIILLDRSLTVGDYVELEDGQKGFVREFRMRYAILETYDGKDILVPNEKFISSLLINWTHKDPKQRYRIDFSVSYDTDIRAMVDIIKKAVAAHPQVLSGDDVPFEERPDCEIDSFGDSGVNMFVEFWIEGIDDGKNRVGGDLLLIVFETLRDHNIEIPYPQREIRIRKPSRTS